MGLSKNNFRAMANEDETDPIEQLISYLTIFCIIVGILIICFLIHAHARNFWFRKHSRSVIASCSTRRVTPPSTETLWKYKYHVNITFLATSPMNGKHWRITKQTTLHQKDDSDALLPTLSKY